MWALMSEVKKVCTKKGNFNAPVLYLVYKESYYDRRLPQPLFCLYILAKQRTIKIEHIDRVTVCLEIKRWFELKKDEIHFTQNWFKWTFFKSLPNTHAQLMPMLT